MRQATDWVFLAICRWTEFGESDSIGFAFGPLTISRLITGVELLRFHRTLIEAAMGNAARFRIPPSANLLDLGRELAARRNHLATVLAQRDVGSPDRQALLADGLL